MARAEQRESRITYLLRLLCDERLSEDEAVELAELLAQDGKSEAANVFVKDNQFQAAGSDQRFDALCAFLNASKARSRAISWVAPDDTTPVRIRETDGETTLSFSKRQAPGFADFVRQRLKSLYLEYQEETGD